MLRADNAQDAVSGADDSIQHRHNAQWAQIGLHQFGGDGPAQMEMWAC